MDTVSVWRIEDSALHWVVAASQQDAIDMLVKTWYPDGGLGVEQFVRDDLVSVERLDDDNALTITDDDGVKVVKLAREWAAENGVGLLCSTEW